MVIEQFTYLLVIEGLDNAELAKEPEAKIWSFRMKVLFRRTNSICASIASKQLGWQMKCMKLFQKKCFRSQKLGC
ncbi:hypothetical protein UZ35_12200 [Heyndrickxia coagulans]|nr:hypothetical protein CIW84_02230 [Heyndrickxia coagulans]KGT38787.1 hypothetical protein P421_07995 [Heyndrickxia coagulans P38]AWP38366.1 hypothetical protein CYJ15_16005 [Heyndrickxia coagulans]KGB29579.1 hypothetical protein IE89_09910 [Heyndrickxia coagulans]KXT19955.1 hypothetical protein UZ35_12200 [Heyndrickxia coagulans]